MSFVDLSSHKDKVLCEWAYGHSAWFGISIKLKIDFKWPCD
jgi:hypothetical protein